MAQYPISAVLAQVDFLHRDWVDGGPHPMDPNARLSADARAFLTSSVLRNIAAHVGDERTASEIHATARAMAAHAAGGLVAGWDEGDELCPPYFLPGPPKPQPDPWSTTVITWGDERWIDRLPSGALDGLLTQAAHSLQTLVRR